MIRNESCYRSPSCWYLKIVLFNAISLRLGIDGVAWWPPFVHVSAYTSLRWGSSMYQVRRDANGRVQLRRRWALWRHYGVNTCDLGSFGLSVTTRRLHIALGILHFGIDLPLRDWEGVRFSLYRLVNNWRRRRRGLAPLA